MHCNFSKTKVYSDQEQITKFNVLEIKALSFVQQIAVIQLTERSRLIQKHTTTEMLINFNILPGKNSTLLKSVGNVRIGLTFCNALSFSGQKLTT